MALQGGSILIVDTAWQLKMETGSEEAGMLLAIQTGSSQAQNYFNGVAGILIVDAKWQLRMEVELAKVGMLSSI